MESHCTGATGQARTTRSRRLLACLRGVPGPRECRRKRLSNDMLAEVYEHRVHNFVIGDFNFVTGDKERMAKAGADCRNNSSD